MSDRADCTAGDCTTLNNTAAKATAATVPTAYSAVLIPSSLSLILLPFTRWAIRLKEFMPISQPSLASVWVVRSAPVDDAPSCEQPPSAPNASGHGQHRSGSTGRNGIYSV